MAKARTVPRSRAMSAAKKAKPHAASQATAGKKAAGQAGARLLSGGNPQIAKGEGDPPVQAYIAAVPGWKRDVARRIDALVVAAVPGVHKAVKWNSPFYGRDGEGWFLSFHCFAKYIKVAFFRGAALDPAPPVGSRNKDVRYLHLEEGAPFDETQFTAWVKQASRLPGERM
jgi:hypothetical protein